MTPADVTSALGTAPKTPPKTSSQAECDYSSPSAFNYLNVMVQSATVRSIFQSDATTANATQSASGLGDAAYETPVGANAGSILVLKGQNYLRIDLFAPMTASTQSALKQLATTAIGRVH